MAHSYSARARRATIASSPTNGRPMSARVAIAAGARPDAGRIRAPGWCTLPSGAAPRGESRAARLGEQHAGTVRGGLGGRGLRARPLLRALLFLRGPWL